MDMVFQLLVQAPNSVFLITAHYLHSAGRLNDLWRLTPDLVWTWMAGSKSRNQRSILGLSGEFSADFTPGAREVYATWVDNEGHLWFFGGYGVGEGSDTQGLLDILPVNS